MLADISAGVKATPLTVAVFGDFIASNKQARKMSARTGEVQP
jgi:hypothetical protein